MAFKAKRPVLIRIQPQYVKDIKSGEKDCENRCGKPFVDCNCFILHQSQEGQGIVGVIEVGPPDPKIVIDEDGKKRHSYPILRVFDFKETIPIETAFDNTPIKRKISSRYQDFTYLRDYGEWTPETEAAAAEAVKILLSSHKHTTKIFPKQPKQDC
ncbi:MAG: hypothetical protein IJF84_07400 [Thermoguttaceae bacterium]|nr:hypothetical protein [Thermoguttaceae bacterium]